MDMVDMYPLVMTDIAIEHDHLQSNFSFKMVIFHSYVSHYQRVCHSKPLKHENKGCTSVFATTVCQRV